MSDASSTHRLNATVATATIVAFGMIGQQVAAKATRDALFLSKFPVAKLPIVMVCAAAISVVVVVVLSRLMTRSGPARITPLLFLLNAILFVTEYVVSRTAPGIAAVMLYLHTASMGAAVVSSFWSIINERFDPHTAKRVIGRIAVGATAGGVVGGLVAWQVGARLSLEASLIGLAGLNILCAGGIIRVRRRASERPHVAETDRRSGLSVLREVPYLRQLAALIALGAIGEATIDYVFKARAQSTFQDSDELIFFFALFYTFAAVATFLLQSILARVSLQQLGLSGTVATLPATITVGSVLSLLFPGLGSIAALRGGGTAVENSLFRSGYELLFTPLTPARKRPTKTLIDVGCDKLGGAAGSGIALAAIAFVPMAADTVLLVVAIITSLLSLAIVSFLHGGYIRALADSLRRGSVELDDDAVLDATTRRTLADTTMAIDRDKLLQEIALLRKSQGGDVIMPVRRAKKTVDEPVPQPTQDEFDDPLLRDIVALRSRDASRMKDVLKRDVIDLTLVPHLIALLSRNDIHRRVIEALSKVADPAAGQLLDALVSPDSSFAVRRRIPRVLTHCSTQRAVDGLVWGLKDDRFEVRYRTGVALAKILRKHEQIAVPEAAIFAAARREAEVGEHIWRSQKLLDSMPEDSSMPFAEDGSEVRLGRSLEHVFNILALVLDREPLQLAYRALAAEDEGLRGTGLEYLENVLPNDIRSMLWPYLGDRRVTKKSTRQRAQIVDDLMTSMSAIALDLEAIRKEANKSKS